LFLLIQVLLLVLRIRIALQYYNVELGVSVRHTLLLCRSSWTNRAVFVTEATLGESYHALEGDYCMSKNKDTFLWNLDPSLWEQASAFVFNTLTLMWITDN